MLLAYCTCNTHTHASSSNDFYHPRMQRGNAFGGICLYICVSTCHALTFQKPWLESSFLVCTSEYLGQVGMSRSSGQGQGHRSKQARLCMMLVGCLLSTERQSCFYQRLQTFSSLLERLQHMLLRKCRTPPGDLFPGNISVLELAQHVHLTEDTTLVEEHFLVAAFLVVVVFIAAVSKFTSTRRQQTPRLITTSTILSKCPAPISDTIHILAHSY